MKRLWLRLILVLVLFPGAFFTALPSAYGQSYVEGSLAAMVGSAANGGTAYFTIAANDGRVLNLTVSPATILTIDGIAAQQSDFRAGMDVYATLQGTHITSLQGYATAVPGYNKPESVFKTGAVISFNGSKLQVRLSTGEQQTYTLSAATVITRGGQALTADSLCEGDQIKLYLDAADAAAVSRIEVEGSEVQIVGIYKGTLNFADTIGSTASLNNVEVLQNGDWVDTTLPARMPYDAQNVYIGGSKVSAANLKYYQGKTVYAVGKNELGQEALTKMVVQSQYETIYEDKIKNINWYSNALELDNNQNLSFSDGTIISKSGRLVDNLVLDQDADVLVIADGRDTAASADVISVLDEGINNSAGGERCLYAGRLSKVLTNQVVLKHYNCLDDNSWDYQSGSIDLYYDNDTGIVNLETDEVITCQQFLSGDYAVDESSDYADDNDLSDWYAYVYTDGDRIIAIGVQQTDDSDNLDDERVTAGTITAITDDDLVGTTISLNDARDWSSSGDSWKLKDSSLNVGLSKTVIIKNNKVVTSADLAAGDNVYIIRDDFKAKVLIVK